MREEEKFEEVRKGAGLLGGRWGVRKNFGGIERDGGSRDGGSWVQGNLGGKVQTGGNGGWGREV